MAHRLCSVHPQGNRPQLCQEVQRPQRVLPRAHQQRQDDRLIDSCRRRASQRGRPQKRQGARHRTSSIKPFIAPPPPPPPPPVPPSDPKAPAQAERPRHCNLQPPRFFLRCHLVSRQTSRLFFHGMGEGPAVAALVHAAAMELARRWLRSCAAAGPVRRWLHPRGQPRDTRQL